MTLAERLAAIRPLADDSHFGVREWAWIAVRPHLAADLDQAIALLAAEWTSDRSERIRRFASESIRPRGVWCAHLSVLKKEPERALPVLGFGRQLAERCGQGSARVGPGAGGTLVRRKLRTRDIAHLSPRASIHPH